MEETLDHGPRLDFLIRVGDRKLGRETYLIPHLLDREFRNEESAQEPEGRPRNC